jgi:glutamine synthetase
LDGISNRIDPGLPIDKDLSESVVIDNNNIKSIPSSLGEVLVALENDHEFLLKGDVFTSDLIKTWITYKRNNELEAVSLRPHPYEFNLYYDV